MSDNSNNIYFNIVVPLSKVFLLYILTLSMSGGFLHDLKFEIWTYLKVLHHFIFTISCLHIKNNMLS